MNASTTRKSMGIFALLCAIALGAFFSVATGHNAMALGAQQDQQNVVAIQDTGQAGHVAIANSFLDFDGHQMAMQRQPQIAMQATKSSFDYGHVAWRDTGYQIAAINRQHFTFNRGPQTRGPTIAYMDGQSGGLGHRLALTRLQEGAQHLQV